MKIHINTHLSLLKIVTLSVLLFQGTSFAEANAKALSNTWEFNENKLNPDWRLEAEAKKRPEAVVFKDGKVKIITRANTWDRIKITTTYRQFGPGTYTWRVFVPSMGIGDMASVGAFIYFSDKHELDFEVGSGTAAERAKLKAAADELLCYCTNQASPFASTPFKIKGNAWYDLSIELASMENGNLLARWSIQGKVVKELQTQIPATTRFGIHCSVENLKFIGDHQPRQSHQADFDRVTFTPAKPQKNK